MSSEQNPFGLHVMPMANKAYAWTYLDAARPAMSLWLDDVGGAVECKRRYPSMHVVHRSYNANDTHWHQVTIPLDWAMAHLPMFQNTGVIVTCYNEPWPYSREVIDFTIGAWRQGKMHRVSVVGPNYSVGNPNEKQIQDGFYDDLIREVCANEYAHLGLHQYTKGNPEAEHPFLNGREKFWYERAETLGLTLTRVLITEHGLDMGGGKDDGWRNQNISGQQYADLLIRARALSPYKPPVALFGFGNGFGWESFNVDDDSFLNTVHSYRETVNEEEKPVEYTWKQGTVISTRSPYGTNIRTAHRISNEALTGTVLTRDMDVEYDDLSPDRIEEDGYLWWPIHWNGQVRWVAVWNVANQHWVCEIKGEVTEPTPPLQWRMPVDIDGYVITANFGEPRDYDGDGIKDDKHEGIDFAPAWLVPDNIIVSAMAEGVVEGVRDFEQAQREGKLISSYGCYVRIRSKDGAQEYIHWYAHLSLPLVKVGNVVSAGSPIGVVGSTGNSSGNHVHITIQAPGKGQTMGGLANVIDPATLLSELA